MPKRVGTRRMPACNIVPSDMTARAGNDFVEVDFPDMGLS
jgi:hypothetical protein